jgi:hypothetical protein
VRFHPVRSMDEVLSIALVRSQATQPEAATAALTQ